MCTVKRRMLDVTPLITITATITTSFSVTKNTAVTGNAKHIVVYTERPLDLISVNLESKKRQRNKFSR